MKRLIPSLVVLLLAASALASFRLQPTGASGTICVGADSVNEITQENEPLSGAVLRIGIDPVQEPRSLNPLVDVEGTYGVHVLDNGGYNIFNCLIRRNGSTFEPELAYDWFWNTTDNSLAFYLNDSVTWHDGETFNASAVQWTFNRILNDPDCSFLRSNYQLANITRIDIDPEDPYRIVFNVEPYGPLLSLIAGTPILPAHWNDSIHNDNPVGTGPYKHLSWTPNTVNWTMQANEHYFKGRPNIDYLNFTQTTVEDLPTLLANNQIDLIPGYGKTVVDPSYLPLLSGIAGVTTINQNESRYIAMGINLTDSVLSNKDARMAIDQAINESAICSAVLLGFAEPSTGPIPLSAEEWYTSNVTIYENSLALANQTLDNAGFGVCPDGYRFNITIKVCEDYQFQVQTSYMIRDWLLQVKINAAVQELSFGQFVYDWLIVPNFDLIVYNVRWLGAFDPGDQYKFWHSTGDGNKWGYTNAAVDECLENGLESIDFTQRRENYTLFQQIIAQDLPNIFLYYPVSITGYNNDFHGFHFSPPSRAIDPTNTEIIWYEPTVSGEGNCPYRVCFTDFEGRCTGYFNGSIYADIPNSLYTGVDSDPQQVRVRSPLGTYNVTLTGVANDSYSFEVVNIALDYKKVWIKEGYIHENETVTYIVRVYANGVMKVYDVEDYSPRDIGVLGFVDFKAVAGQGFQVPINVEVFNFGDAYESFNATVYVNETALASELVENMPNGTSAVLAFSWDTTAFALGDYTVRVELDSVEGELETSDNSFTATVHVGIAGDVNADGYVGIDDIFEVASHFGAEYGNTGYSVVCDINSDQYIGIDDIFIAASHFGEEE